MRPANKPHRFALPRRCCLWLVLSGLLLVLLTITAQGQTVSLSPTTLNFGNVVFGSTSAIKKVTLTNTGSVALSITSIVASANFVETNTCGSSVSAGAKCTISVAFSPTATGAYSGTVTITDNASNSPQTIALVGTGINAVTLSISKLTFTNRTVGTTSSPLSVTLANNLTTALAITGVSVVGDFAQTNTCGSSVAAGVRCTISVTFTPTVVGSRTGTLTVTDSGNNSPQTVSLSGTGSTAGLLSIAVTPSNPSVGAGATQQFYATGTFSGGTTYDLTQSVTWSSTSATAATISNVVGTQGLATALAAGTSTIKAVNGKINGSTLLTVSPSLLSITVTPADSSIGLGTGQQFTATGNFSDSSTQNLTNTVVWSSSATNIATINSTGLATSVATGTTTINATSGSVTGSTPLTVTPAVLLSIAVTPANASAGLGTTEQYKAVGTYSDGSTLDLTATATWSSSATAVTTISNDMGTQGLASTAAVGTTNITASLGSVSGSTGFTVTPATLTTIAITPALPSIPLGTTQQFTATGTFTDGSTQNLTGTVTWSSSVTDVATISSGTGTAGLATSAAVGTTTITATSGTVTASTSLTVSAAALVSIAVTPANQTIASETTLQFTATGTFTDGSTQDLTSTVIWSSDTVSTATINNAGLAQSVDVGSANITATSGTVSGSTTLIVSGAALVSIAVSPPAASIPAGSTQQFTATGTFSDTSTQDVTSTAYWSTSDGTVATISDSAGSQGLATGVGAGSITITAASGSVNGTATLAVTAATLVSISIAPQNPSIALGASQQFTATGTYSDGTSNDITAMVTWASSSSATAVISNTAGSIGLATSAGAGSTTISASLGTTSSSTMLTVGPAALFSIAVTPSNASIPLGTTQSFAATGTYTNGSTQDLTTSVTWSSSNSAVASISNTLGTQGVASGTGLGTAGIAASVASITGSANLTVIPATLVSISLSPKSPAITLGTSQQFTATGTYSDGSTQDITGSVVWTSSTQTVATISNTSGSQGLATSVAAGTSTITGTLGSLSSSTTLTVNFVVSVPTWSQEGPLARFSQSTVFDPTSQQMVIFGGQQTSNSTNLNDVWLAATSLTGSGNLTYIALLPTGTGPSPRFGHVATYDQNSNRMTLFGGGQGLPGPCANDVWILDRANGQSGASTWLSLSPSGTSPNARVHPTGVYDPGSNTLTVFGGSNCTSGFFNDVWVLSNANGEGGTPAWTQLVPSGSLPPARENSTGVYDSTNRIMTIYGGDAGGGAFGDVWVLSNANGQGGTPVWTQLSPTGTAPHVRTGHSSVYDSSNDRMIVFGGAYGTTTLADCWILTSANGLGGTPAWIQLTVQGTAPKVEFHSAVYNQTLNSMYVFAGTSSGTKLQTSNHTFTLTGANGLQTGNSQWFIAGPPVRHSQSAFYDPSTGGIFVFGGQHSLNINFNDYQRDSGVITSSNVAWTKLLVSGTLPAPRFGHTGLYDSASNRMMVFGGSLSGSGPCVNDYWILKQANAVGTLSWTSVSPSGSAPAPRLRHSSVYDPSTNSLIVFGGFDCTSTYFNDVWILSNANNFTGTPAWTHVLPAGTPPSPRESSAAVYDPATNSMILFGGDAGSPIFNDVWVLSHANGSGGTPGWTQLTVSGTGPAARTGHSAVYDSQNSRMTIYGGVSGSFVFSDTWVLSNANSVAGTPAWTQLTPLTPGPPRYYHSAVYDSVSNQMTIFGGATDPFSPDANVFSLSAANGLSVSAATLVSIAINPQNPTIALGTTQQFTATGTYSDGSTQDLTTVATWSSSASSVATISNLVGSQGLATSSGQGTATISATSNSISASTTITVSSPALVSITITPGSAAITVGTTQQFVATGTYTNGSTQDLTGAVSWGSSSSAVATIGAGGLATGLGAGAATITATSGAISSSATLSVSVGQATLMSVAVTPALPSIPLGTAQQFTATGIYSDSSTQDLTSSATWTSSAPAVATVSSTGLATSKAVGTSTITATSAAIGGSTTLTVTPATLVSIAVTPSIISLNRGYTQQFTATGTYTDGSTQNLTNSVTWTSDGASATITSTGFATAAQLGSAHVIATSGSTSGSAILISILTGSVSALPPGVYFPPTPSGTTSTIPQTSTVYNLSASTSTITGVTLSGSSSYQLIGGTYPVTLAPNAFANFTFSFTPSTTGSLTGTATFSLDSGSTQVVTLNGTGTSTTAIASLNATSLAFGNQPLGTMSPAQTVTVTNKGTTSFTIQTLTTTSPFFQTAFNNPVKLNAGSSFSFQINYVPYLMGAITETISITYDVLPNQSISLTGTGTAATALGISTFPTLPTATRGAAYQATLTAVGGVGQTTWNLASGSTLPSGLSLSSAGLITGTLSSSVAATNYSLTAQVTDSNNPPASASLLLTLPVKATTGSFCNNIIWDATGTTTPLVPITDLGTGFYGQYQGGLYANGSNVDDPTHHAYGVSMAQSVQPLDSNGNPNPNGKYVLLTIGHSNTQDVSAEFVTLASSDPAKNPNLIVVNGATGSSSADELQDPSSYFWTLMTNNYLPNAGVSPQQVEIVWLNDVDVSHPPSIPALQSMVETIAQNLLSKFPNTKILYLSSVNYTAYSNGLKNSQPEPPAYEAAFSMKAVIQDQINGVGNINYNPSLGPVVAPWASWAAYYWTNGLLGRSDGLTWSCQDNIGDGVHPATSGRVKAAAQLLNFMKTDDTAIPWF